MKLSEIKIEALKLMFAGNSDVLLPENLYLYKNDDAYAFYLVRMNGSINRCFSRLEAMGVLPPRVITFNAKDATHWGNLLKFDLSRDKVTEFVGAFYFNLKTGEWRKLDSEEYQFIPEEGWILFNEIGSLNECYKVAYRGKVQRLTDVSGDDTEIDIPDGIAALIPLYIKSELYQEDEPGAAAEARNLFEAQLSEIKDNEEGKSEPVRSVYSLADT